METIKIDRDTKLPNMIMCGDHSSFTKTELNLKEVKAGRDNEKKTSSSLLRITPSASRTQPRSSSAHALSPHPLPAHDNAHLLQAALGSFRWPPYLVLTWVLVLILAHTLHCLLAMLDRALPALRKACEGTRWWAAEAWRGCRGGAAGVHVAWGVAWGGATALLHAAWGVAWCARALAHWATEPLADASLFDPKITNYEDIDPHSNSNIK